jgi:hypothetical protein
MLVLICRKDINTKECFAMKEFAQFVWTDIVRVSNVVGMVVVLGLILVSTAFMIYSFRRQLFKLIKLIGKLLLLVALIPLSSITKLLARFFNAISVPTTKIVRELLKLDDKDKRK